MRPWIWLALVACHPAPTKPPDDTDAPDTVDDTHPVEGPTWYADVAPIVVPRCTSCHADDRIVFSLATYEDAAPLAPAIVDAVTSGRMPPWLAHDTPTCAPPWSFEGNPQLSADDVALLTAWADAGAPEGTPTGPAPEPAPPSDIDADQTLTPSTSYSIDTVEDVVMCHALDPGLVDTGWLRAVQLVPGDLSVAHHAVLLLDDIGLTDDQPGWFPCFGGVGQATPLVFWAPGTEPFEAPPDSAIRVPAASKLILQLHWHPTAAIGPVTLPSVRFDWTDPPIYEAALRLLGNAKNAGDGLLPDASDRGAPEFRIPAGDPDHTETMLAPLGGTSDRDVSVWAIGHHMHRFGSAMRTWRDSSDACLLSTPGWDYDKHRLYRIPQDQWPTVPSTTELRVACTYDNTLDHPGTAASLAEVGLDAPIDVRLGGTGMDEMCSALVGLRWTR